MKTRLSATDAFFVAYQETSGVLMQLGVEVELEGRITRADVDEVLMHIVRRWPPLGQRLRRRLFGLSWEGECSISDMVRVAESRKSLAAWRNQLLNPFAEPPFQLLWIADGERHLFAFRAHHAVVDGEGFFAVCAEALRTLAERFGVRRPGVDLVSEHKAPGRRTPTRLLKAFKNLQRLRNEARSNQSARLALRSCTTGDISVVKRDLESEEFRELQQQAHDAGVAPGWLCAAAWIKAIHAWSLARNADTNPLISLEVPVSLRRSRKAQLGNLISPLTLYGDATKPLFALATTLKQQMSTAIRQRFHLALPSLSAPAKFIPFGLFRKLAANPELTGFATSHFAWFEQSQSIHEDILRISGGALQLVDQQLYTPVCLHMGAAVAILAWPERAQIFLTHRLTALSTSDAQSLSDLMVQQLGQRSLRRRQVAV